VFVWPAFGLLVALGTWRALQGRDVNQRSLAGYLALAAVAAGLMSAAAYWGGEMMLAR